MNILSKNTVRTIAVGVVALSISSLGSLAFAVTTPAPAACTKGYLQAATVHGENLRRKLDGCYVNRPAGPDTTSCVQIAFKAQNSSLLAALDNFQRCSGVPPGQ